MNIDQLRIKAVESSPARGCTPCLFRYEGHRGCVTLCDKLVQRGLPDCDDKAPNGKGYVYVLDETDPRQMNLLDREH